MAEETKNNTTVNEKQQDTQNPMKQQEDNMPTVDELMAQLATERAEKEKYKNANDKLSKSEAEMKRQLRAKQTVEEQEAEARAEAQRLADEERESMRKELNHIKAVNAYKAISDEKSVEKLIEAVSEADHAAIASIIEGERQKAIKEARAEWMKSRPEVQSGGMYSSMTKEQIMAIPDRSERRRAMAENMNLFS